MAFIDRTGPESASSRRRVTTTLIALAAVVCGCSGTAAVSGSSSAATSTTAASTATSTAATPTAGSSSASTSSASTSSASTSSAATPPTGATGSPSATRSGPSPATGSDTGSGASSSAPTSTSSTGSTRDAALELPAPTGDSAVGTALLHLRDAGRKDPLDLRGGRRQLMVQVWYPTDDTTSRLAPYAPAGEAAALQQFYPVPQGAFAGATHSHQGAPVAGRDHPVVFFQHGLCASRTDSTIVAEELASRGFVVVALGTTGESAGVEFPDGTVVGPTDPAYCQAGGDPFGARGSEVLEKLLSVRVADVRFVADQLTAIAAGDDPRVDGDPVPRGLGRAMQLSRIGIYGHSFGGATAAAVVASDRRFVAGIDLDGFAIGPTARSGVGKPFLVVGVQGHDGRADASWKTFLPALAAGKAWHRWFSVRDSGHYRFIDLGGSVRKWGLDRTLAKQDPTTWSQIFGGIDDATSQRINRAVVVGFFEQFLDGRPSAVLADPSALPGVQDRTDDMAG